MDCADNNPMPEAAAFRRPPEVVMRLARMGSLFVRQGEPDDPTAELRGCHFGKGAPAATYFEHPVAGP